MQSQRKQFENKKKRGKIKRKRKGKGKLKTACIFNKPTTRSQTTYPAV